MACWENANPTLTNCTFSGNDAYSGGGMKLTGSSATLIIRRMVRWVDEAFDRGALLSRLDLAVLLNVSDGVVSGYVNEYQTTSGRLLPTRGNIHDLSGHITHKREIVSLYLQGHDTPRIARKTRHSKESVDRYIRDFETVRLLTRISTEPVEIGRLARLNPDSIPPGVLPGSCDTTGAG